MCIRDSGSGTRTCRGYNRDTPPEATTPDRACRGYKRDTLPIRYRADQACSACRGCSGTHQADTMSTDTTPRLDVQLYRVTDAVRMLNLSRTAVFELLRSGRLRSVKQGRTRLIPASAIRDYITLLEHEAEASR